MTTTEITTTEPRPLPELWEQVIAADQQMACVPRDVRAIVQDTFRTLWSHIQQQDEANALMVDRMNHARALIEAQRAGIESLEQQRDAIADEYANLLKDLELLDSNNRLVRTLIQQVYPTAYQRAMEDHNAAFWESLPYDMAAMMNLTGRDPAQQWGPTEAGHLYALLTMDLEEDFPEDYGWTQSQVIEFRQRLLAQVQAMEDGYDGAE